MISGSDQVLVMLVTFVIGLAYHLPFLRVRGATLGMLACGLRVVMARARMCRPSAAMPSIFGVRWRLCRWSSGR